MMRRVGNFSCKDLKVGRNAGSALRMVIAADDEVDEEGA
jgi:hypothetical protein